MLDAVCQAGRYFIITMSREQEVKQLIQNAVIHFKPRLKGYHVFFFGSRVAGHSRERSDFDIGISGRGALPIETFSALQDAMDDLPTLYKIDLVDLTRASSALKKQAHSHTENIL